MQVTNLITQVKFVCGCQYVTPRLKEAQEHVLTTGHGMWVQGTITAVKEAGYGK